MDPQSKVLAASTGGPGVTETGGRQSVWLGGPALVAYLAAIKFALHFAAASVYGLFVDELYFLACGEHLAWGYVDMPPLTAVQAHLTRMLFGDSPYSIRLFPSLLGAGLILIVGALARELGGKRYAQFLAALAALIAPGFLVIDSYISMNSVEPVLVAGCAMVLVKIIKTGSSKLWLAFGGLCGIGLLNKHTMLLFGFGFILGLLLTPERKIMFSPWFAAGGAIALLVFSPNLIWMWQHHFPHLEVLANIRRSGRDVSLSPIGFMLQQLVFLHPAALPVWVGGLGYLIFGRLLRPFRSLGFAYLIALGILLAVNGRTYYLLPGYVTLLAAGGVAVEHWVEGGSARAAAWIRVVYAAALAITGTLVAPVVLPVLAPERYIRYSEATHVSQPRLETRRSSALPQLFADRFGWPEMAQAVADAYMAIPEPERSRTGIFGQDYGQAGCIDFYGPKLGLPKAISGHLTYWYWGPREFTGESLLVMGDRREVLESKFQSVEKVGEVGHQYAMASQHFDLFLCRHPKGWNLQDIWPRVKNWD